MKLKVNSFKTVLAVLATHSRCPLLARQTSGWRQNDDGHYSAISRWLGAQTADGIIVFKIMAGELNT